jgi:hypothetical protein
MNRVAGIRQWMCALVCVLIGSGMAGSQVLNGEVFGKVSDQTDAVLPGATVTLAGPALITAMTVVAADSGGYRFANVPIGTYTVSVELAGFNKVIREGVIVQAGRNVEINVKLSLSTLAETVTITGASPVVDTKSTTLGVNFGKELLEAIPTARDPWVIIEQTPGLVMAVNNVGGRNSGQMDGYNAFGSGSNKQWSMDGATVTDMASNSAPTYYDFEMFEEIQIQTGGMDASQESGGVSVNMVTRSGGNQLRGSGRVFTVDQRLQSKNAPAEVVSQGGGAGNPLKNNTEYGIEVGGPIKRDKAWFWGSASNQSINVGILGFLRPGAPAGSTDINDLNDDITKINNQSAKLQYAWNPAHKSTFLFQRSDKIRNARGASSTTALESTSRQTGPTEYFNVNHQWIATNRLMMSAQALFNGGGFLLDFHSDDLATVQRLNHETTGDSRSGTLSDNHRPTYEARVDGSYFLPSFLRGDHSTKFGLRYRRTPVKTITKTGGGATVRIRNNGDHEVNITRDGYSARDTWQWSLYFNDSWKMGRGTLNWGVRWDRQDDKALAAEIDANPILPDLLPAVAFDGADAGVVYNDIAPRIGFTYDVFGDTRTVAKISAGRYYGAGLSLSTTLSPTGQTTLSYWWKDRNGDLLAQRDEIEFNRGFRSTPTSNYDPSNPASVTTPAKVASGVENDITDELIAGIDHELMPNFGVGMSYIYRRYHNFQASFRDGVTTESYIHSNSPVTFTRACGNTLCDEPSYSGTYYQRTTALPAATTTRMYGGYTLFNGVEVTARKRFSSRWLMNSSFSFNNTREFNPVATRDYTDPTNREFTEGRDSSGLNGARWLAKMAGMYALPWSMSVSAFYNLREGLQFNRTIQSPNRTGGGGTVNVRIDPQGTRHYPVHKQLDINWDKTMPLGKRRVTFSVTGFNLLNASTVLGRETRQDFARANYVTSILAPRIFRVGAKVNF